MKKDSNEPKLLQKKETVIVTTEQLKVEVLCESSTLHIPPEFRGDAGEYLEQFTQVMPAEMLRLGKTKVEAKYTIEITRGSGEKQVVKLSDEELAQVWGAVSKVLVGSSAEAIRRIY